MRLVCPNCDAEYEVDSSAIPDSGRDVQCSNCGHAWFQLSPQIEEQIAAEDALFEAPPPEDVTYRPDPVAAPPRALDESVLAVLREEAERETTARRAETPILETQSEMGLTAAIASTMAAAKVKPEPEPAPAEDPVAQRIARMKGIDPTPPKLQSRREMLPEIDEINSTLRASSEKRSGDAAAVSDSLSDSRRGPFRSGFLLMLVLAALVVAMYVMAPKLAQQIPGAAPALKAYVGMVDTARIALDNLMQGAIGMIRGASD